MNFIQAPQPQVHYAPEQSFLDELARSPQSTHSHQDSMARPVRAADDFPIPTRNPYGSYSHYDAGTVNGERVAGGKHSPSGSVVVPVATPAGRTVTIAAAPASKRVPVSNRNAYGVTSEDKRKAPTPPARSESVITEDPTDAFMTAPTKNPYGSYSHYDNGTVSGQKVSDEKQINDALATPTGPTGSSLARAPSQKSARFSPDAAAKEEYTFKRKHRMPTISDRVPGMSPLPGAGMVTSPTHLKALAASTSPGPFGHAPTPAPSHSSRPSISSNASLTASQLVSFHRQIFSPKPVQVPVLEPLAKLLDSPLLQSPSGYDSDSSHASSSSGSGSGHQKQNGRPGEGHHRSESTASSLGVPTYEKHVRIVSRLFYS